MQQLEANYSLMVIKNCPLPLLLQGYCIKFAKF